MGSIMEEAEILKQRVNEVIEKDIKPFIEADGGFIKLRKIEGGIAYVSLGGVCAGCPGAAMTLRGGVEKILRMKIDEIKGVELAF